MNFDRLKVAALFAALLAAACNSGGGKSTPADISATTYDDLLSSTLDVLDKYKPEAAEDFDTPTANMPISGSAIYSGVATVTLDEGSYNQINSNEGSTQDFPLAANARMTADFSKKTISGNITDFKAFDKNEQVSGKINYTGDIVSNSTSGRFRGKVMKNGENFNVDLRGKGGFAGKNADGLFVFGENTDQSILVTTEK